MASPLAATTMRQPASASQAATTAARATATTGKARDKRPERKQIEWSPLALDQ